MVPMVSKEWCNESLLAAIHPQTNGVVERTIGLMKNWTGKNANSKEFSTRTMGIGRALNVRSCVGRPTPSEELDQWPFTSPETGRGNEDKKAAPEPNVRDRVDKSTRSSLGHCSQI